MVFRVYLRKEAQLDISEAFEYYESCRKSLGSEFIISIDDSLDQISKNPRVNKMIHKRVRRALIKRFPFGVFYLIHGKIILVIAVMHARKNPSR